MSNQDPRDEHEFTVGDLVHETGTDDASAAVVVRCPVERADEYVIDETGETIAEYNAAYDADAPVVTVVFKDELDQIDAWDVSTPESLWELVTDTECNTYTYPAPALTLDGTTRVTPRWTDDGLRYIQRLHITTVGDRLVFGTDYDGVDHQYGRTRDVCFHRGDWDVAEENLVSVQYSREKDIEDLPPMLVDVATVSVRETIASPDSLLDL